MIIIRMFGGLGNQLFQYAFCQYLRQHNTDVYMDISEFKYRNYHYGYEVSKLFKDETLIADEKMLRNIRIKQTRFIRLLEKLFSCRISKVTELDFPSEIGHIDCNNFTGNIYLNGYWQDIRYIEPVASTLRESFCGYGALDNGNREMIKRISNVNSVSIHVRRGDYLNNKSFSGICDHSYYRKAISYIKTKVDHPVFFIFSDDIPWCREHFKMENNIFCDVNSDKNSYKDLLLMSCCKHNILCNSTFSWWGAWLNINQDKLICIPRHWSNQASENHLIYPDWTVIVGD